MLKDKNQSVLFACFDPASITVPAALADLYAVPTDIIAFWVAIQPAMEQVMATQPVSPVRWGPAGPAAGWLFMRRGSASSGSIWPPRTRRQACRAGSCMSIPDPAATRTTHCGFSRSFLSISVRPAFPLLTIGMKRKARREVRGR
jgi:hypothetical protein